MTDIGLSLDVMYSYNRYIHMLMAKIAEVINVRCTGLIYLRQQITNGDPDGLTSFLCEVCEGITPKSSAYASCPPQTDN